MDIAKFMAVNPIQRLSIFYWKVVLQLVAFCPPDASSAGKKHVGCVPCFKWMPFEGPTLCSLYALYLDAREDSLSFVPETQRRREHERVDMKLPRGGLSNSGM